MGGITEALGPVRCRFKKELRRRKIPLEEYSTHEGGRALSRELAALVHSVQAEDASCAAAAGGAGPLLRWNATPRLACLPAFLPACEQRTGLRFTT